MRGEADGGERKSEGVGHDGKHGVTSMQTRIAVA